jgi:DNA-binding GntR family transcriptional regulator
MMRIEGAYESNMNYIFTILTTILEHDRLISALATRDRARCAAELEHHRYSAKDGLPIELPGIGDDLPSVTN